jgi:sulfatase modifying factor 1
MRARLFVLAAAASTLTACYGHVPAGGRPASPPPAEGELVSIPAGAFTRGDRNGEPDEYPERLLELPAFRLDRAEASNADYRACVEAGVCDPTPYLDDPELGLAEHPVVGVTFEDATRYCAWRRKRLPTEAEWEYAARGTDLRKWPWKGLFDPARANTSEADAFAGTAPVQSLPEGASVFGVLNVAGNAAEWVADYFDPTYYRTSTETRAPKGPERGRERVVRGGSYRDPSHLVRVSARRAKLPTEVDSTIGVRCAAD